MRRLIGIAGALVALVAGSTTAAAFCGFYVSGAGADLFNNATQVVMMREGTRTVLSMQNSYDGPPENFAMVVPVPVVLQKENVKTLDPGVFKRVDELAAPRLVEYWEEDPCMQHALEEGAVADMSSAARPRRAKGGKKKDLGVTVEAQFKVGEYEVVILSAKEATGLDTWLRQEKYKIPEGAEPYLRPYVESGSKFFVAKVDVSKVTFKDGRAMLSPLRFHYDTEQFALPVRLGMMNSQGTQDLIVHILARGQRYEVANYPNVTIPTNLDVIDAARDRFGEFYAALFDRTLEKNAGAVVTEYSWDAGSCDPCPTPPLSWNDLATLGSDVLDGATAGIPSGAGAQPMPIRRSKSRRPARPAFRGGFVLTRLHARYSKDALGEDLIFKAAEPIAGGREFIGKGGGLEEGAVPAGTNNFQARYAIRHEWTGPMECKNPVRGRWGGPPAGVASKKTTAATDLAFVPRGKVALADMVRSEIPEIEVVPTAAPVGAAAAEPKEEPDTAQPASTAAPDSKQTKKKGCGCAAGGSGGGFAVFAVVGLLLAVRRRRRVTVG